MHLLPAFINSTNILITLHRSQRQEDGELQKTLVFLFFIEKHLRSNVLQTKPSVVQPQKYSNPFKCSARKPGCLWEHVRRRARCSLMGLPSPTALTTLRQNKKRNRLWEGRKVSRDRRWVTGTTSINTLSTQIGLETSGDCAPFPNGILGNSINLFCHILLTYKLSTTIYIAEIVQGRGNKPE